MTVSTTLKTLTLPFFLTPGRGCMSRPVDGCVELCLLDVGGLLEDEGLDEDKGRVVVDGLDVGEGPLPVDSDLGDDWRS